MTPQNFFKLHCIKQVADPMATSPVSEFETTMDHVAKAEPLNDRRTNPAMRGKINRRQYSLWISMTTGLLKGITITSFNLNSAYRSKFQRIPIIGNLRIFSIPYPFT
jgi:hypothetical protein